MKIFCRGLALAALQILFARPARVISILRSVCGTHAFNEPKARRGLRGGARVSPLSARWIDSIECTAVLNERTVIYVYRLLSVAREMQFLVIVRREANERVHWWISRAGSIASLPWKIRWKATDVRLALIKQFALIARGDQFVELIPIRIVD